MKKSRAKHSYFESEPQSTTKNCEYPGCAHAGEYKAPRDKQNLRDYRWFCLEHVRE